MGERLKSLLGLPEETSDTQQILDEVNLRIGVIVSILIAVLSVIMVAGLAAHIGITASFMAGAWYYLSLVLYIVLFGASLHLARVALPTFMNRTSAETCLSTASHSAAARAIALFAVACTAVGMLVSYLDYQVGEQAIVFVMVMVMCSCVFVVRPRIALPYITISFIAFFIICLLSRGVSTNFLLHYWSLWALLMVVSVARFSGYLRVAQGESEARHASTHDDLTGLENRLAFRGRFSSYVGRSLMLILIDLDDFKYLNELYGHASCNEALKLFSEQLLATALTLDCYRYGGDQFLLIGPDQGPDAPERLFENLSASLASVEIDGSWMALFFSCGWCRGEVGSADDLRTMLRLAEFSLNEAKGQGKHRICGSELSEQSVQRLDQEGDVKRVAEQLDVVSGLPTMASFRLRATQALHARSGFTQDPALVYFNVENFRSLNRAYGFEGGDAFLKTVAQSIQEAFPGRLVARSGEDHFVALVDTAGLTSLLEQVHERVHGFQGDVPVELKCGIYQPGAEEWDIGSCCDRAKLACDSLRNHANAIWRFYDEELGARAQRQEYVADHIDQAVEEAWIEVFYQPVIRVQTGALCGMEALARWHDPDLGYLQPVDFIDTLERRRLIHKLDLSVIDQVCERFRDLLSKGLPVVPVSLNFSRLDFELCDIKGALEEAVERNGVPRSLIDVEITESAFAGGPERVKQEIEALKQLGYHVWMDDFGSGYSSFSALKGYGFDVVKMDRLFLIDFEQHPESRVILGSMVSMAKQMSIQTLCEGVETSEQLAFLASIGCEKAQGYLFSKPLPYEELMGLLDARGIAIERPGERAYFDCTGQINLIGPSASDDQGSALAHAMGALAVVDLKGSEISFLSANAAFRTLMKDMGMEVRLDAPPRIEDFPAAIRKHILSQLQHVCGTKEEMANDYTIGSHVFNLDARCIAQTEERSAYVLVGHDLMGHGGTTNKTLEATVHALCLSFSRVDLLSLDGRRAENLYLASARYRKAFVADSVDRSLIQYAEKNIYEPDQEKFLALYDLRTAEERFAASAHGHLCGYFRTRNDEGSFGWQLYLIMPITLADGRYLLSCVRDLEPVQLEGLSFEQELISSSSLWKTALGLIPVGLFWKDAKRQFVGASQAFLDYYGLSSVREIAGKTDEEMGWHIDPDPFSDDEWAVLREGRTIRAARGLCIRQGEVRNIEASKVPIYEDGSIVGLLGFFHDITDELRTQADPESAGGPLTGGVLDLENYQTVLQAYQAAYEYRGLDFAYVRVAISNARGYEERYGRAFASRLTASVIKAIRATLGNTGVVHHQSGTNLVVVKQVESCEACARLCEQLREAVARVAEVDGRPCQPAVSLGACRWSEVLGASLLMQRAEERCAADAGDTGQHA